MKTLALEMRAGIEPVCGCRIPRRVGKGAPPGRLRPSSTGYGAVPTSGL
jgi:hypothetical protein